jgi:phosphohistidine phosphatase
MHIYLLRHCDAIEHGFEDFQRPLSPLGRIQAGVVGRYLRVSNIHPGALLSSPMVRTVETAELIREELQTGSSITSELLLPGSDIRILIAELNTQPRESLLLVGHEPHLRALLVGLTGKRGIFFEFRKGTLVALDCPYPIIQGNATFVRATANEEMVEYIERAERGGRGAAGGEV